MFPGFQVHIVGSKKNHGEAEKARDSQKAPAVDILRSYATSRLLFSCLPIIDDSNQKSSTALPHQGLLMQSVVIPDLQGIIVVR